VDSKLDAASDRQQLLMFRVAHTPVCKQTRMGCHISQARSSANNAGLSMIKPFLTFLLVSPVNISSS
jgi:hypothetical protein